MTGILRFARYVLGEAPLCAVELTLTSKVDILIATPPMISNFNPSQLKNIDTVAAIGSAEIQSLADDWAKYYATFWRVAIAWEPFKIDLQKHKPTFSASSRLLTTKESEHEVSSRPLLVESVIS